MKNLVILLLLSAFLVSASSETKPPLPKVVYVDAFSNISLHNDLIKTIKQKSKEGFIVKTVSIYSGNSVLVMEKY